MIGVVLQLTLLTGTDQRTTVIYDGSALGAGLPIRGGVRQGVGVRAVRGDPVVRRPFLRRLFIGEHRYERQPLRQSRDHLWGNPDGPPSFEVALVLGAVLVVSGPTVIGPLLDFIRPSKEVNSVLKWEGTLADPIGATLGVRRLQRRGCRATAVHGPITPNPMVDRSPRSEGISRTVVHRPGRLGGAGGNR